MRLPWRTPDPWAPDERWNGLSRHEHDLLAAYNGEKGRGITHTPLWQQEMAALQARWDAGKRERMIREGWTELPGGGWIRAPRGSEERR